MRLATPLANPERPLPRKQVSTVGMLVAPHKQESMQRREVLDRRCLVFLCKLVEELSGVALDPDQSELLAAKARLAAFKLGFETARECIRYLMSCPTADIHRRFVDELIPHETSFFRDPAAFTAFSEKVVPELLETERPPLRIWSAACATGQEAYSLAIALAKTHGPDILKQVRIYASDISEAQVLRARRGRYTRFEISRGLSDEDVSRYFRVVGESFETTDFLRNAITFFVFDIRGKWTNVPPIHVALVRNVLIYMTAGVRKYVLDQLAHHLVDTGYVLTGTAESLHTWDKGWRPALDIGSNWYRKLCIATTDGSRMLPT